MKTFSAEHLRYASIPNYRNVTKRMNTYSPPKPRDQNKQTSNIDVPVNRLKAANSRIKVPAQAVQVSVSVPVRASGCLTPNFKLTQRKAEIVTFIFTSCKTLHPFTFPSVEQLDPHIFQDKKKTTTPTFNFALLHHILPPQIHTQSYRTKAKILKDLWHGSLDM